jgi:hypothetical protein
MTELRDVPNDFAISAAVRPAACSTNSRLSRDGVQLDFMAAHHLLPKIRSYAVRGSPCQSRAAQRLIM